MNIIVLIKEVPDMESVRFDRERGVIDRSSAKGEINPFDLYALQLAVDLKRQCGGQVTAVSMGPKRCIASLRDAWARGADKCICVTDRDFGGADTYATSKTLASVLERLEYDLIICGEKTVDGDTAQVGAGIAEMLDIPHSYYVDEVMSIKEGRLQVLVSNLCGLSQVREMKLPALISVGRGVAHPLLPALKRKVDSVSVEVECIGLEELSEVLLRDDVGLRGSPTKVSKIVIPQALGRNSVIYREDMTGFARAVKDVVRSEMK